jgi:hypothetical protein
VLFPDVVKGFAKPVTKGESTAAGWGATYVRVMGKPLFMMLFLMLFLISCQAAWGIWWVGSGGLDSMGCRVKKTFGEFPTTPSPFTISTIQPTCTPNSAPLPPAESEFLEDSNTTNYFSVAKGGLSDRFADHAVVSS